MFNRIYKIVVVCMALLCLNTSVQLSASHAPLSQKSKSLKSADDSSSSSWVDDGSGGWFNKGMGFMQRKLPTAVFEKMITPVATTLLGFVASVLGAPVTAFIITVVVLASIFGVYKWMWPSYADVSKKEALIECFQEMGMPTFALVVATLVYNWLLGGGSSAGKAALGALAAGVVSYSFVYYFIYREPKRHILEKLFTHQSDYDKIKANLLRFASAGSVFVCAKALYNSYTAE